MNNFSNVREIQNERHSIARWLKTEGKLVKGNRHRGTAMLNGTPVTLEVEFSYGNRTGWQPGYIQVGYPDGRTWLDTQTASEEFYVRNA